MLFLPVDVAKIRHQASGYGTHKSALQTRYPSSSGVSGRDRSNRHSGPVGSRGRARRHHFIHYPRRIARRRPLSPDNVWAVGASGGVSATPKTLILHWNGTRWSQVTSPKPVSGVLYAVTAVSANNAWAVGKTASSEPLIMHWNGLVPVSAPATTGPFPQ
jgi:hypothetical protein